MKKIIALLPLLTVAPAEAQTPSSPEITRLQSCIDGMVERDQWRAQAFALSTQLQAAKARIEELEPKKSAPLE